MNHYSVKPIRLDLRPSRRLALLLGLAASAACGAMLSVPVPLWSKLAVSVTIAAAAVFHIARDAGLRMPASILAIEVSSDGTLRYLSRRDGWCEATVRGESFVTPALTVLSLAVAEKRWARPAVLMADSGDAEVLRRLRVWLRWGSQALPDG